jgi:hypothetical protein
MTRKKQPPAPTTMTFETFKKFGSYECRSLTEGFGCWNGEVSVRKYRVTIEPVEEPNEVVCARVQHLWDTSDNWHHSGPLQAAANSLGYVLQGQRGGKR